ncbi:MAG: [FeFe] hydrogenase H-cluster maturation GTPase HydF [Clostridiales bacterium]|jgi:[FeFe] hydrogenase H-cluster maturation GTPase HydF|nr:[FeFe] hydrogenase H-cluster maturation GTPase HydF [Clostridiales bacterium]
MNAATQSGRMTVAIFGACNAGKSSLFNAITDTDNAIVSDIPGTTTDPVVKVMELLPHGPITLIDTAGLGDGSPLGEARVQKTAAVLNRANLVLYAIDPQSPDWDEYRAFVQELKRRGAAYLTLITKADACPDTCPEELIADVFRKCPPDIHLDECPDIRPNVMAVSSFQPETLERLKAEMAKRLDALREEERDLLGGLLPAGAVMVCVIPVDSEAPVGRLILPEAQMIRACLDHRLRCHVTTELDLADALRDLRRVDLVVTDSQAFGFVSRIVPPEIPLTSFSILMARQKGDLKLLLAGVKSIPNLRDGDKVLVAETCTHNRSHEDIGRVKIPKLLLKITGKNLDIHFTSGREYPENLNEYALIIHCGGCMIARIEMINRLRAAREHGAAITNYGLFLAYCNDVLDRSLAILRDEVEVF